MNTLRISVAGPVKDETVGEICTVDVFMSDNLGPTTKSYLVKSGDIYAALCRAVEHLKDDLRTQKAV